jgi:hypothetical protein
MTSFLTNPLRPGVITEIGFGIAGGLLSEYQMSLLALAHAGETIVARFKLAVLLLSSTIRLADMISQVG